MAEGDEDHGAVTMTPAVTLGGIDQPVDLGAGQMFPGPIDGVRFTSGALTVRFTMAGGTSFRGDLVMVSNTR